MKRHIYAFDTIDAACSAVVQLRECGVDDKYISLIARRDIQTGKSHDRLLEGAALGGGAGLSVAIVAMAVLPLGPVIGSSMLLTFLTGGAILGAWMSTPIGPIVPAQGPRTLEDEVDAGRTLLVVDSDSANEALVTSAMADDSGDHLIWRSVKHTVAAR